VAKDCRPSLWKILGIYLGGSALVGVCVVGVLYGVALGIANWRQSLAERHWAEAGLPVEGYLKSMPHHPADDRARRLDEAGKTLGLSLLRIDGQNEGEDQAELKARREAVRGYLKAELASPESAPLQPPEALTRMFVSREGALEGVRSILLEGPPTWKMQPSLGNAAELPALLDHITLCQLLVSHALAAHADGRATLASEDCEAAWNLSDGLAEHPQLLARLIELEMRREIAAAVRKVPVPASDWMARMSKYSPEEQIMSCFRTEAAVVDDWASSSDPLRAVDGGIPRRNPLVWLGTPYFRFMASRMMDYQLAIFRELGSLSPCATDEEILAAGRVDEQQIPAWDTVSRFALTQYGPCWARARYCRIQLDLTRNVLSLRMQRDKLGRWPESFAPAVRPQCPSEGWDYRVSEGGEMSLRFTGLEPSETIIKGTAIHPAQSYREPSRAMGRKPPPAPRASRLTPNA